MDRVSDGPEDETLDLTEELELDETDSEDAGGDEGGEDETDDESGSEEGEGEEETVIGFSDDTEEEEGGEGDSSVIRKLRQELRETKGRLREVETANVKPTIEVGPKPTLADCDFDEEKFETALTEWQERKRAADAEVEQAATRDRKLAESWQRDLSSYNQRKASIGVADFDVAEDAVKSGLNEVQQAVLVKAASDPAALVVALSRSPAKLAELAKFEDPIKMAAAIARMEGTVKVIKRRKGPEVDKPQNGSGRMPGGTDQQLAKLEKDAERTGDRTKLIRYKKQKGIK